MEGSCSTDLSGLNIITLRQIAVDDSLPPDVYIARIANAVQVTICLLVSTSVFQCLLVSTSVY